MKYDLHIPTPASMLARWQEEYAAAYLENRLDDQVKNAGRLYRFYAAIGQSALARKWTEEYIRCWSRRNDAPPSLDGKAPDSPVTDPCGVALWL